MRRIGSGKKRMKPTAALAAAAVGALAASGVYADPNTTVDYTIRNVQLTNWGLTTDWSPNSLVGGPDATGLYVSITAGISNVRTVTVSNGDFGDSTKTIGRLDLGDTSGYSSSDRFVIAPGSSNGVIDFNGSGGNALINTTAFTSGDRITAGITLSTDLDIVNNATNSSSTLQLSGVSSASPRTLTVKRGLVSFTSTVGSSVTLRLGDASGTLSAGMSFASNTYNSDIVARSGTTNNTLTLSTSNAPVFGGLVTLQHDLIASAGGSGSITLNGTVSGAALTGSSNLLVTAAAATNNITLGGNNSGFTGAVSVNAGTFRVSTSTALSSANVVAVDTAATFLLNSGTTVASSPTIAGLNNGVNGGGTVSNTSTQTRILTLDGTGDYTFGGTITASTLSTMGLVKSGAGTQTLTGASGYTGATTISGGKLIVGDGVSGSLGNTAVNVTGGMLGGRGSIAGSVNVGASGTLGAGTATAGSIGTLSTGALTLAGKLAVDVDTTTGVADQVAVTGAVNVSGATLSLSINQLDPQSYTQTFVLINNDGGLISGGADAIVGSFTGLTRGGPEDSAAYSDGNIQATLFYGYDAATSSTTGGNDLAIQFTSVPEPAMLSLLSVVPAGLLKRRRRETRTR